MVNLVALIGNVWFCVISYQLCRKCFVTGFYRNCLVAANALSILVSVVATCPMLIAKEFFWSFITQAVNESSWVIVIYRYCLALMYACTIMQIMFLTALLIAKKRYNNFEHVPGKYEYLIAVLVMIGSIILSIPFCFLPAPLDDKTAMTEVASQFVFFSLGALAAAWLVYIFIYFGMKKVKILEMALITLSMTLAVFNLVTVQFFAANDATAWTELASILLPITASLFHFFVIVSRTVYYHFVTEKMAKSKVYKWAANFCFKSTVNVHVISNNGNLGFGDSFQRTTRYIRP
ncbi:unnamed protein product [Caenorhabditis brenneri]